MSRLGMFAYFLHSRVQSHTQLGQSLVLGLSGCGAQVCHSLPLSTLVPGLGLVL